MSMPDYDIVNTENIIRTYPARKEDTWHALP